MSSSRPDLTAKDVYEQITTDLDELLTKIEVDFDSGSNLAGEVVTEMVDIAKVQN